jgi:uncharacterized membrane protein YkvA (DUF1232 family)
MRKLVDFLRDLAEDTRIPFRNRVVLMGLLAYLLTPIDIIPDFIPILGWLDDAFVSILILDYIFNSTDSDLILEHYPWNKEGFHKMKTYAQRLSWLIPPRVKKILFTQAGRLGLKSSSDSEKEITTE